MENKQPNNPLHGVTLQLMLEQLVAYYGFDTLGELIKIRCFNHDPNIKSSLTFLRKTEWARKQVETLYIKTLPKLG
ncbi:MAG: transporter [Flavobacterium sp.]|uniref:VF530 family protein n=1 Tax=Flavobacterium sp. TaxID=239 RepID=UPI0025C1DDF1|nr:VF530 family protein [Flavobacterium sp.]MBA4135567.1 transporter [Flavobacterium sp.]